MSAATYWQRNFAIIAWAILFVHYGSCTSERSQTYSKCLRKAMCGMTPTKFAQEADGIVLDIDDNWKNENLNSNELTSFNNNPCERNAIRRTLNLLFGKSLSGVSGCSSEEICDDIKYTDFLSKLRVLTFSSATEKEDLMLPFKLKLTSMIAMGLFFPETSPGSTPTTTSTIKKTPENLDEADQPGIDSSCLKQQSLGMKKHVDLFIQIVQRMLWCDHAEDLEIKEGSFLQKILLQRIFAVNTVVRQVELENQQTYIDSNTRSTCGDFGDQHYIAKLKIIMDASKNILGCQDTCIIEKTPTKANIDGWFIDQTNSFSSEDKGTRKRRGSSDCPQEDNFFSVARKSSVIAGLKHVLKDSLDCRFNDIDCKFISKDSIEAQYFKLEFHYGCVKCMTNEFCAGKSKEDCIQIFKPSTLEIDQIRSFASSLLDCNILPNKFILLQLEKNVHALSQFLGALYAISVMFGTATARPSIACSSECNWNTRPSSACNFCEAKYIAETTTKLITGTTACTREFFLFNVEFCKPSSVKDYLGKCTIKYDEEDYGEKGKELLSLAYAIGALTGCGQARKTNIHFSQKFQCGLLQRIRPDSGANDMFPTELSNTRAFTAHSTPLTTIENLEQAFHCDSICPFGEEYCTESQICMAEYLKCSTVAVTEEYLLLGHVDIDLLSSTLFPARVFPYTEVHFRAPDESHGQWKVISKDGVEYSITSSRTPMLKAAKSFLWFKPKDVNSYGARILKFSSSPVAEEKDAILLIRPIARAEDLNPEFKSRTLSVVNQKQTEVTLQMGHYLGFKTEVQNHEIPEALYRHISRTELNLFYQYKKTYLTMQPMAKATALSQNVWYIKDVRQDISSEGVKLLEDDSFPVFTTNLTLIPPEAKYAPEELKLEIQNSVTSIERSEKIDFDITVHLIQPITAVEKIQFPPLPYKESESVNDRFNVKVLEKSVSGRESLEYGIAIYGVFSENGVWQYKKENDDTWKVLCINSDNSDSSSSQLQVLHLSPKDSLKFHVDADTFWSMEEAENAEKVIFRFWEMDIVTDFSRVPLGMSNGFIRNDQISASSTSTADTHGYLARFNLTGKSWCSKEMINETQIHSEYVEVDFKSAVTLTGIATEGDDNENFVSRYYLQISMDGDQYLDVNGSDGDRQVFVGNTVDTEIVYNWLTVPARARFVRFRATAISGSNMCIRMEYYGSRDSQAAGKMIYSLGMESGVIEDSQISQSNTDSDDPATNGRLRKRSAGWCSPNGNSEQWMLIDFKQPMVITAIATQGHGEDDSIKETYKYYLQYKEVGSTSFQYAKDTSGEFKKFTGNEEFQNLILMNFLPAPVTTQFLKIVPIASGSTDTKTCLRAEIYGYHPDCSDDLTLLNSTKLLVSSFKSSTYVNGSTVHSRYAWCAKTDAKTEYITVDLGSVRRITGFGIQGDSENDQWPTKIKIGISLSSSIPDAMTKEYTGAIGRFDVTRHWFEGDVYGRYIKFKPIEVNGGSSVCMRIQVLGCLNATDFSRVPLGMSNGFIRNDQISVSTSPSGENNKNLVRLKLFDNSWSSKAVSDHAQITAEYVEVDFKSTVTLTGVATKGNGNGIYVRYYFLRISMDGNEYNDVKGSSAHREVFVGNTDDSGIVYNWFSVPTRARFVRFHADAISGSSISVRIEYYGSRDSEAASKVIYPLGMENGAIEDSQLSQSDATNSAVNGRLWKLDTGWCVAEGQSDEWMQIDFKQPMVITAVATQGKGGSSSTERTSKYYLKYKEVGSLSLKYVKKTENENMLFEGNKEFQNVVVMNFLPAPVKTQFLRIIPVTSGSTGTDKCLRAEVYGYHSECSDDLTLLKSTKLLVSSFKSSTYLNGSTVHSRYAWCASTDSKTEYITVDLGSVRRITGFGIQGDSENDQWPTKIKIEVSQSSSIPLEMSKEYTGAIGRFDVTRHWFKETVYGRYIKFMPTEVNDESSVCMRIQVLGCLHIPDFSRVPLGMSNGFIRNDQISVSSTANGENHEYLVRLKLAGNSWRSNAVSGQPQINEQYVQVDFKSTVTLTGIATKGNGNGIYVSQYFLKISMDGKEYNDVKGKDGNRQVFSGNTDDSGIVYNWLSVPTRARFVLFRADAISGSSVSVRIEYYGSRDSEAADKVVYPLGMESGVIEDSQLSQSNEDAEAPAQNGRLWKLDSGWCSPDGKNDEWMQIDFKQPMMITAIATQGHGADSSIERTYEYYLQYKEVGSTSFQHVKNSGNDKMLFKGNEDFQNLVVMNLLPAPVKTQFLRVIPVTSGSEDTAKCLRAEVYGYHPECSDDLTLLNSTKLLVSSSKYSTYAMGSTVHSQYAWCASTDEKTEYITVDLGSVRRITGFGIQGDSENDQWPTKIKIGISKSSSEQVKMSKEYIGAIGRFDVTRHWFEETVYGRYIKFMPTKVNSGNSVCMRIQVLGCLKLPDYKWVEEFNPFKYSNEVAGTILRNGCDNVPASMLKLDDCGVCNGTNECVACDGVAFSNASIDDCGECTGGDTGRNWNFLMDACGVCEGDDSTCAGCDGVAYSGKIYDFCDDCLHPDDALFDKGCITLTKFSPTMSSTAGGRVLLVEGEGIHNVTVAKCILVHEMGDNIGVPEVTIDPSREGKFNITTPAAPVGTAQLQCTFGSSTKQVPVPNLQLTYYDPDVISITTVTPSELDLNSQRIELTGTEFNLTTELYCAYMAEGHSMLIEASIQSATAAECNLPSFPYSTKFHLTVVAAKEDGSLASLQKLPNDAWKNLTIYALPPKVASASLSDDFMNIVITFQNRTESRKTECSDIFEIDVETAFGSGARCVIEEFTKLVVYLGTGAIKVPTSLTIKSNVTYAFNEMYAHSSRIVFSVKMPSIIPAPVATLTGRSKVGRCDSFVLKAELSGFTGNRPVTYNWDIKFADTVDSAVLTNDDKSDLERLKSFFNQIHTEPTRIEVTSDMLKPSTSVKYLAYSITLKVSNFLFASSNTSIIVQRVNTNPPIVQILGGVNRYIKATEKLLIIAKVQTSPCETSTESLQYQWMISPDVELNTQSQNTPRLLIPPKTFRPGSSYRISLTVRYPSNPSVSSTAAISVTANISQLVAKIKGGQYRAIGSEMDLVLDASQSYDPDSVVGETELYEWSCIDSSSNPCVRVDSNDPNGPTRLSLPRTSSITIGSGTLAPNEEYVFQCKYTKGSRSAYQSVYITVVPGMPPIVNIRPLKKKKVNFNDKIVLKGRLTTRTSTNTDVWWESVQYEGGRKVRISDSQVTTSVIRHQINRIGVSSFVLILKSSVLSEGAEYKFRLNAQNLNGLGFASITLTVNGPPTAGLLTSNILEGVALESLFNLQATSGWSDAPEDMPLTYRFGFKGKRSKDHFLGGASLENQASVLLPVGTEEGNRLNVFVDVSDKNGATSRSVVSVTVNPMSRITTSTIDNLSNNIKSTFQTNDVSAAVGQLTSTLAVLNEIGETGTSDVSEETKAKIIAFKEETSSACLSMLGSASDAESQNMVVDLMPDITKGGESFSGQLKRDISQSIANVIKSQVPTQGSQASPPITFTFADTDDTEQDIGKSPDEISRIIQIFQNILNTSLYDNTTMQVKREFTGLIDTLLTSLCAKSTFGESALVAFTGLSVLQSFKYNLFDNGASNLSIASNDWESSGFVSGLINLGKELASKYGEWQCTDDFVCNGLCLGSVQLPQDLYSDKAMRENNTMISAAMKLNLYNPETNAMLTEEQLTTPITFLVPLDDTKYNKNNSVECKYWDEASSSWKNDSCKAEQELTEMGSITYVTCKCYRTGAVAAFEVAKVVSGTTSGAGGSGVTNWGGNAGNATRSNPLLTLFIFIGMLGFSLSLGFGFCGFERFKALQRVTPNE